MSLTVFLISYVISVIHDSTPCLLCLLLLAELFVHSSSRPAPHSPLCGMFRSMNLQLENLRKISDDLYVLADGELTNFEGMEHQLDALPHIQHTAAHVTSLKVNESLSLLSLYTQSFRLHADWLITAKENVSFPSQSAEGASSHLLQLSNLINASLLQIGEEVPQSASPTLPVVSTAFEVLKFSIEISGQLQVFCDWSKRMVMRLKRLSRCPRH
ncbi:uncharacterized protein il11b [Anoplopoma fimbria]|uniref:uncharacterized protein il11b n=1 Tax=Anoplopoma fimbria TaxID=229290 RepID=UPI0023EB1713|nr:uncharacterized protein il11b [Anoplopoma fimbria]